MESGQQTSFFEHLPTRMSIFPGALEVDDLEESLPGGGVRPHPPAPAHTVHTHPDLQLSGKVKQKLSEISRCH